MKDKLYKIISKDAFEMIEKHFGEFIEHKEAKIAYKKIIEDYFSRANYNDLIFLLVKGINSALQKEVLKELEVEENE